SSINSKNFTFLKFKHVSSFLALVALSVLFWRYGSDIAFNDMYIFANVSSKIIALCVFWLIIFMIFALRPLIGFFYSLKNGKKQQFKELKKISNESISKAKRNFFISIKDAKNTWKTDINLKKLPLVLIMGI
ncbi:MAG: type VI secretion system membrane subunit TssM, partial [Campylobacter sp.]|nr:type VI secretion system membrane subunit TssM [Campylobacter sp.]